MIIICSIVGMLYLFFRVYVHALSKRINIIKSIQAMEDAYECLLLPRVDQGAELDTQMMDALDLRGLESTGPIPKDAELIVMEQDTLILCIPIRLMTQIHDKLWSIPMRKFAMNFLAGRRKYSIRLSSESPLPETNLHYDLVLLPSYVKPIHGFKRYLKYTNVTELELSLVDVSHFMGLYLPEHPPSDTEISLIVNGIVALQWNYTQMLLHNKRNDTQASDILLETIPLNLAAVSTRLLRCSHPVSLYVISRQVPSDAE